MYIPVVTDPDLCSPTLHDDTLVTLPKNHKKLFAESTVEAGREEDLLWSTMTRTTGPGIVLAVVPRKMEGNYTGGFATSCVVHTTSAKPDNIIERMSAARPKVIFVYAEYLGEDEALNQREKEILRRGR